MCIANAMQLSLKGETFLSLKEDFDTVLARTIGNMEMKGAEEATITLKLVVSLEKATDFSTNEPKEVTKPSFKHDISSVMQVKDKKSGALAGDYMLVWDEDEEKYVMSRISDRQINMFDKAEEYEAAESEDGVAELPYYEPALLEAPAEEVDDSSDSEEEAADVELDYTDAVFEDVTEDEGPCMTDPYSNNDNEHNSEEDEDGLEGFDYSAPEEE